MKKLENMDIIRLLRRSVGNPGRGVDLAKAWDTLIAARPRCQNDTPRVLHDEALLRRGITTVHNEQFFGFLFPSTSYLYTNSLRTLIND